MQLFTCVKIKIRFLDEGVKGLARRIRHHAQGYGRVDGNVPIIDGRFFHSLAQGFCQNQTFCQGPRRGENKKFLAAPARGAVLGADILVKNPRNGLEHPVARVMAVGVVDGLEVVNVGQYKTKIEILALRSRNLLLNPLIHGPPIEQPCEKIAVGHALQFLIGRVQLVFFFAQRSLVFPELVDEKIDHAGQPAFEKKHHANIQQTDDGNNLGVR